jgi:cysteine desulfurase
VHHIVGAAHKFNGPQGIGFLYAKGGSALHSLICGGGQERDQRAGTENAAGIVGLAKALEYTYSHLLEKTTHLQHLKAYLYERLRTSYQDDLLLNGSLDNSFPSVLNVSLPAELGDGVIVMQLDIHGVSVSGGSACTSGSQVGSHVLAAMGQPAERIGRSVRFSFGFSTTDLDLDFALAQLEKLVPVRVAA